MSQLIFQPFNGVDQPDGMQYFIQGSDFGASSFVLLKGFTNYTRSADVTECSEKRIHEATETDRKRSTVISIVCNRDCVDLYELADRLQYVYEQGLNLYEYEGQIM